MSRIGRNPITIPAGTTVAIAEQTLTAQGPKGELQVTIAPGFTIKQDAEQLVVEQQVQNRITNAQFGLLRTLIDNAVQGVTNGFAKKLEMNGVGFRVEKRGNDLQFALGFSHKIDFKAPEGIELQVEGNSITVSGADKQQVGAVAAEIRALKKPEPYKGKGIKYADERIRRKAGKAAAKAA
ncbi:50S ribosomal protein L6 [bacterium]|nr:50S ribosomal protein L6 [bacterium]